VKPNQQTCETIVPVHQARKKDETSQRENDLPAAGFFSRIWFFIHDAAHGYSRLVDIKDLEIQELNASLVPQFAPDCY
jgi:hypothetical protein